MKITQVKVYPYVKKKLNGEVGIGQVVLDDLILLTGLKLVERHGKRFILYPVNYKNKRQLCFVQPIKKNIADEITDKLFTAYSESLTTNADQILNDDSVFMAGIQEMVDEYNNQRAQLTAAMALQNSPESNGPDPDEHYEDAPINTDNLGLYEKA